MKNGNIESYEQEKLSAMVQRKDWAKLNKFVSRLRQRGATQMQLAKTLRELMADSYQKINS